MACNICKAQLYIKTIRYTAPLMAPLTEAEALRQALINKTGEEFVMIEKRYCPMCGEPMFEKDTLEKREGVENEEALK